MTAPAQPPRARWSAKWTVAVLVLALAGYFALIGYRGVILLGESSVTLQILGIAVLAFPLIGGWIVVAELRFGAAAERLANSLGEDAEPLSRRTQAAKVQEQFELRRAAVQAAPHDWRAWYRLAVAYDQAGDRRRARTALRTAIERAGKT